MKENTEDMGMELEKIVPGYAQSLKDVDPFKE